jgi:hypothetical protein
VLTQLVTCAFTGTIQLLSVICPSLTSHNRIEVGPLVDCICHF